MVKDKMEYDNFLIYAFYKRRYWFIFFCAFIISLIFFVVSLILKIALLMILFTGLEIIFVVGMWITLNIETKK